MSETKAIYGWGGKRKNTGGARPGSGPKEKDGYSKARKLRFLSKEEERIFYQYTNREVIEIILQHHIKNSLS